MFKRHSISLILALIVTLSLSIGPAAAQSNSPATGSTPLGTAFTYQGQLKDSGGNPVNATCAFNFSLWDSLSNSAGQIGSTLNKAGITVSNGLFTVQLDFGAGAFDGNARWLGIAIQCGSDASPTTLSPRQPLTPAPYSLYAATAGTAANLSGVLPVAHGGTGSATQNFVDLTTAQSVGGIKTFSSAPSFNADSGIPFIVTGSGLVANLNADLLDGLHAAAFWKLAGNSGTDPASNFLGTLDNVALELRVNNARALRIEPNATSPNLIGGYSSNTVSSGAVGATVGGGGISGLPNSVTDDFGTVGGGAGNQAGDATGTTSDRTYATVSGGYGNIASGLGATIGGGGADGAMFYGYEGNTAGGNASTIAGGMDNHIDTGYYYGTIGGGKGNVADGEAATVSGGEGNHSAGKAAAISGGESNSAFDDASVGGGKFNHANGEYASIPGGYAASATHYGEMAHASGYFSSLTPGDAQASEYVLRNTTSDANPTELFLDGSSQRITLAAKRSLSFDILLVGETMNGLGTAGFLITGMIQNTGTTTRLVGTPTVTVLGRINAPDWAVTIQADTTDNALSILVTGATSANIRWVASVRTAEVNW